MHFYRRRVHVKRIALGPVFQTALHRLVGKLIDMPTLVTNRKDDQAMLMIMGVGTCHIGVQTLYTVHQAVFDQLVQRSVNLLWSTQTFTTQLIQQRIGARRSFLTRKRVEHE